MSDSRKSKPSVKISAKAPAKSSITKPLKTPATKAVVTKPTPKKTTVPNKKSPLSAAPSAPTSETLAPPSPPALPFNKQAKLIALLQSPTGASLDEMMTASNWQAHSVRGFMSGVVRKKLGMVITSSHHDGVRRYHASTPPAVDAPAASPAKSSRAAKGSHA